MIKKTIIVHYNPNETYRVKLLESFFKKVSTLLIKNLRNWKAVIKTNNVWNSTFPLKSLSGSSLWRKRLFADKVEQA